MSAPTREKVWFSIENVDLDGGIIRPVAADRVKSAVLWFKNRLIDGASIEAGCPSWTVVGSCNGVTAALDGVDRWATITDLLNAAPGTAHSWLVLAAPAGGALAGYYLYLDLCNPTTASMLGIGFSKIAPAGGSTTVRPPAADMAAGASGVGSAQCPANLGSYPTAMSLCMADDGSFFWYSRDWNGSSSAYYALFRLADTVVADDYPVLCCQGFGSCNNGLTFEPLLSNQSKAGGGGNYMRTLSGAGIPGIQCICPRVGGEYVFQKTRVRVDAFTGRTHHWPIWVFAMDTEIGVRGRIPDFYWGAPFVGGTGQSRSSGIAKTAGGVAVLHGVESLWAPFNRPVR